MAQDNQLELLKFLVEEGKANVERGIRDGMAPLFPAAQNGHCEVIRYLVRDAGANVDPHASLDSRVTPLFYACKVSYHIAICTETYSTVQLFCCCQTIKTAATVSNLMSSTAHAVIAVPKQYK